MLMPLFRHRRSCSYYSYHTAGDAACRLGKSLAVRRVYGDEVDSNLQGKCTEMGGRQARQSQRALPRGMMVNKPVTMGPGHICRDLSPGQNPNSLVWNFMGEV